MVAIPTCERCGEKNYGRHCDGKYCQKCYDEIQDELDKRDINNTAFPGGIITTWNSCPSFLDKKNNYMYFRIPESQRVFFDPSKQYQIIVKEL